MTGHPRSRWLFLALALLASGTCVALGLWQLARHRHRKAVNEIAAVARALEPRVYPGAPLAPDVRVRITGTFDPDHEFVLRGRAHDGAPGVEVATPLRIAGSDSAVIVVRGFVPADDAMSVDRRAIAEPGERTVRGIAFPIPTTGIPVVRRGDTTWDRIPGAWARLNLPYPVAQYAIRQERDSGMRGFPIRLGAPALTEGPHFSYMLQWFGFAVIFAGGGIVFTFGRKGEA